MELLSSRKRSRCLSCVSLSLVVVGLFCRESTMACAFLHRLVASVPTISTTIAGPAATTACNFGRGKNVRMFASAAGTVASAVTAQEALSKYEELAKNLREIDALEGISGTS